VFKFSFVFIFSCDSRVPLDSRIVNLSWMVVDMKFDNLDTIPVNQLV
jgi:hypothetical protein